MRTRHVAVAWTAMLAYYGWLKFVLLFTLICAGVFVGTALLWGYTTRSAPAIETRDGSRSRTATRN